AAEQPHETGQANQFNAARLEFLDNLPVVLFSWNALGGNAVCRQSSLARDLQAAGLFTVGNYCRDLGLQTAGSDLIGNRFEIRSTSGKQDAQPLQCRAPASPTYTTRSPRDSTTSPISEHGS